MSNRIAKDRLVGEWEPDKAAGPFAVTFQFKPDGTFENVFGLNPGGAASNRNPSGTWKVVEEAADRLTIVQTLDIDGAPTKKLHIEFDGDDAMWMWSDVFPQKQKLRRVASVGKA